MMEHYILVILATVLLAVDFTFQKGYQQKQGTDIKAGLTFNAVVGLVTAILFFCVNGFAVKFSFYAIIMANCMSICLLSYTILGFRVLKEGNMAFYTMFLMTGGMVVPYVWGVLFLNESLSVLRVLGLIVIVSAIVLSNCNTVKSTPKTMVLCIVIFFLNGGCSVISKLCQIPGAYGIVEPTEFVMWTGITRCLLCSAVLFISKSKIHQENGGRFDFKTVLPIIVGSAVVSGVSYMLQLIVAANLPATVLYPIVSGGSIIFSTIAGILCFKEKPGIFQKISVALCFIGTCLFL